MIIVRNIFGILFMITVPLGVYLAHGIIPAIGIFAVLCFVVVIVLTIRINDKGFDYD